MTEKAQELSGLIVKPLTAARWKDLEALFGQQGACGGCWCMFWLLKRSEFERRKGPPNKRALRRRVASGRAPGLLAYVGGKPAGWCSVAPRSEFPTLGRSRLLRPVDGQPVWSVVCFFVAKPFRHRGLTVQLLRAAVDHARRHGAGLLEGYPTDTGGEVSPDPNVYMGLASAFRQAGFEEVARRSGRRPIMRIDVRRA